MDRVESAVNEGGPGSPTCEIVTIGTELLIGQILDTNTTYLAQELIKIGMPVRYRTAAGDRLGDMERVIGEAAQRCDMVITTGGLGPTEDDLTRQAVANVAGVPLEFRQDLMGQIEEIFRRSGYKMPDNNRRQAFVPAGSEPIPNPVGTAPCFITDVGGRPVIALPGVPRELKYLMTHKVIPWIRERFSLGERVMLYRTLKVVGIGESGVDSLIGDLMAEGRNPEVGLLASPGEVTIRLTASAGNKEEAESLIRPVETEISKRLGDKIYGGDGDTLEAVIDRLLIERGVSLAVLETFTGGLAALRLHQVPSGRLAGSLVLTDRSRFCDWLGTRETSWGVETALEAARRVKEDLHTDLGLASLGFMKKVEGGYEVEGHSAAVGEFGTKDFSWRIGGDLAMLQQRGSVICLNTLRLALLEIQPPA